MAGNANVESLTVKCAISPLKDVIIALIKDAVMLLPNQNNQFIAETESIQPF